MLAVEPVLEGLRSLLGLESLRQRRCHRPLRCEHTITIASGYTSFGSPCAVSLHRLRREERQHERVVLHGGAGDELQQLGGQCGSNSAATHDARTAVHHGGDELRHGVVGAVRAAETLLLPVRPVGPGQLEVGQVEDEVLRECAEGGRVEGGRDLEEHSTGYDSRR